MPQVLRPPDTGEATGRGAGQGQAAKEKADDLAENEGCAVLLTTLLVGCALREVVVPILFDGSSYSIGSPTGVWRCQKTSRAI